MLSQVLYPENYRFTIYALPMLIAGVAILIPGFLVLFQAGRSRVGASYFLLCLTISLYMASSALNNASIDVRLSLLWTKVGNIGVIFIPSSVLLLTALLFGLGRRYRSAIAASIGLSVIFMLGLFLTDLYIRRIELFPWGHWGQYGPLGIAFIFYFIAIMALVLRIYWQAYRHCTTERQKKRYRGLLTAFIGGYLGSVDFLPSLGIPIYPFGYLSVGFFIVVSTYVIIRYRLADITPELAAGQILETMQGAVIVADLDGRIRVINRAALDMIGLTRAEVLGGDLATVIPIPAELGDAVRSGERVISREMIWQGCKGRYDVSLSASLLTDMQDDDPVGFVYVATDITERKRMEESLRTGEERLRLALSAANQGWFDLNVQTGKVVVSPEYAIMLGYDPASFATSLQTWINDIHADDRPLVLKEYQECLATGGPRTMEYRRRTKTNDWKWISSIGKIFEYDVERKPLRMIGIHTDVTERRRFMEACRESEERFRAMVESTHDWLWEVDENARYTYVSPRVQELLGYEPQEVIGRTPYDLMTPEEARRVAEDFGAKAMAHLPLIGLENVNVHKDGHPVMLETSAVPVIDAEGRLKGYRGIDRDITNRKLAEEKIRQLVHEQQIILDTLAIGVIFVKKRIVLWANPAFRTMFGFSQREAEGMEGRRLYADSRDYERVGREGYALIAKGESYTTEAMSLKRDGSTFWIRFTGSAVNPDRPAEGSIWMLQDITDQKRSEEALRQSEEKYRLLVEAANSVVLTWDTEGRILFLNAYGERFFGFAKNELIGRNIIGTIVPEIESSGRDLQLLMEEIRNAPDQFKDNENENMTRDGRRVWVRWANKAILDRQGNLTGILSIGNDITARRQAEAALWEKTRQLETLNQTLEERVEEEVASRTRGEQVLMQQSKLAAMGEMLGAIAHQWRQPLNALALIVQNLQDAQSFGELNKEYIEHAVQKSMAQIQHMSTTIEDFRNFFRPDRERTTFDAMRAVGEVLSLFSAQLSSNHISYRLTCHTHGKTFEEHALIMCPGKNVEGYHNEFEHVILNLINNARDAIIEKRERGPQAGPDQGLLTFEFYHEGGKVILDVGDNGGGIPGDILGRIFEPYFTTKDPAKGTGLGLYMSKVIIEDHMQGKLTARNSAQGAVVRIELPQAAGGAPHD